MQDCERFGQAKLEETACTAVMCVALTERYCCQVAKVFDVLGGWCSQQRACHVDDKTLTI